MEKHKLHSGISIHPIIVNGGAVVVYIAICVGFILACRWNAASIDESIEKSLAEVLLDTISNTITIATGIIDISIAVVLGWQRKDIPRKRIAFVTVTFFAFVYFNSVALEYPLNSKWIVFVDSLFFVLNAAIVLLQKSKESTLQNNKPQRIIGNINNKHIIAEQLFSVKRIEKSDQIIYALNSMEHTVKGEHDVNGILSVTYRLPVEDDTSFAFIRNAHHAFVCEGKEETKNELIKTLTREKNKLTQKLQNISSPEEVTPDDCCLARLLIIYLAFLRILNPPVESSDEEGRNKNVEWYGGEAYIGELSLAEGEIGIDVEIEKRLFTLLRTGLLGAVLVGHELRYLFSYKKDGYKIGRRYSAANLSSSEDTSSNIICLITLANIHTKTIPQYITDAIRREENRIANATHKLERGEM